MWSGIAELISHEEVGAANVANLKASGDNIAPVSSLIMLFASLRLGHLYGRLLDQGRGEKELKLRQEWSVKNRFNVCWTYVYAALPSAPHLGALLFPAVRRTAVAQN